MKILLLDNHDSFTYNLAELLRCHGKVTFNIITPENLILEDVDEFDKILFSPGPGLPEEQPEMYKILHQHDQNKPVLGICLGLQAIAIHYGGRLYNLPGVIHGQSRNLNILNRGHYLFEGIPKMTAVGLYHSWAVQQETLPDCLETLAVSSDGIIMALAHKTLNVCGVQFHPESIMTPSGQRLLNNWLDHV